MGIVILILGAAALGAVYWYVIRPRRAAKAAEKEAEAALSKPTPVSADEWRKRYKRPDGSATAPVEPPKESA